MRIVCVHKGCLDKKCGVKIKKVGFNPTANSVKVTHCNVGILHFSYS